MTVSTLNSYTEAVANGTDRTFYFDFALQEEANLYVFNIDTANSGTQTLQTAYDLDSGWGDNGGSITFHVDEQPANGITVRMERNIPVTQETDYIPGDPFPAETHEDALDKLTMLLQSVVSETSVINGISLENAITVPRGDTATNLVLDFATERALKYLAFDSLGNVITLDTATGDYTVSAWAKTLLDDADAEEGRDTLEMYDSTGRYNNSQTGVKTTLTDAASIVWNVDTAQIAEVTLTANRSMGNPTNQEAGGTYTITVIQDGTGSRTLSWGSAYKWEDATAPTLSSGADERTIIFFWSNGTYMYGGVFWKEVT